MKKNIIVILSIILFLTVQISLAYILNGTGGYNYKSNSVDYVSTFISDDEKYLKVAITSYDEYESLIDYYDISDTEMLSENDLDENDYIVDIFTIDEGCSENLNSISELKIASKKIDITYNIETSCGLCAPQTLLVLIPVKKNKITDEYSVNQHFKSIGSKNKNCDRTVIMKPILYLYPTIITNVNVKISKPEAIISSYPKYIDSWDVTANPNGDLFDTDGKYYYALYWDETNYADVDFSTGFYVSKDNATSFLEDKLSTIGLNDRERNEFIMYWLPILEKNQNSLVYFELTDERQSNNELSITPKPDSLLRVNMHVKKISDKQTITEQKLPTFTRIGFTAVEWGGTIHE